MMNLVIGYIFTWESESVDGRTLILDSDILQAEKKIRDKYKLLHEFKLLRVSYLYENDTLEL